MKVVALSLAALLAGSSCEGEPARRAEEGPPFALAAESFQTPDACVAHLASLVKASAPPLYDRAVGPYSIAPGDVRAHRVRARDWGHEIEEHRCVGSVLKARRWSHSMNDVKPFTMEDIDKMSFPE